MTKKKEKKPAELYWQDYIDAYFKFTITQFDVPPVFDGSSPRDLKSIVQCLRKRAEEKGIEWTKEVAMYRFNLFLGFAWSDKWLSENWMLQNINRQKEKIFYKAAKIRQ